ncbi:preprotein translocase subunit SecG [Candidatus Dojkabacteria bacterium]|nr:preprotein translocase subunit SecG [Candidatus Dojkabacteria bacterium]
MRDTLLIVQIVLSVLIVIFVLLQNRAEGLGTMFGGGGEIFRTKRGLEKFLYYGTILLAVLFSSLSLIIVKLSN